MSNKRPPEGKLEIACFGERSAILAGSLGVDRIELCEDYQAGGLTPSADMFLVVKKMVPVPVFVMIRPSRVSFNYEQAEYLAMKEQIRIFKQMKADGFVFGILNGNDEIDAHRNRELVQLASPLPCTFHRAFDRVKDYRDSLEKVIACGFKTLLTSGLQPTAVEGIATLRNLVELAGDRIVIMPGGGIRSQNIRQVRTLSGASWFHSAAITGRAGEADGPEILKLMEGIREDLP